MGAASKGLDAVVARLLAACADVIGAAAATAAAGLTAVVARIDGMLRDRDGGEDDEGVSGPSPCRRLRRRGGDERARTLSGVGQSEPSATQPKLDSECPHCEVLERLCKVQL